MDMLKSGMKNLGMQMFFIRAWGSHRDLPKFAKKSFREMWLEQKGTK